MLTPEVQNLDLPRKLMGKDTPPDVWKIAVDQRLLFEVWLLDTGRFLVLRDVPEAYRAGQGWVRRMRQRRVLRMFLPESEIARLPAIETTFEVAKRGFEIKDAIGRWRQRAGDALLALRGIAQHTDLFPAEETSGVRTIPYEPPPTFWRTREERAKLGLPPRPGEKKAK
jgi:hypothetical protein